MNGEGNRDPRKAIFGTVLLGVVIGCVGAGIGGADGSPWLYVPLLAVGFGLLQVGLWLAYKEGRRRGAA